MSDKLNGLLQRVINQCNSVEVAENNARKSASNSDMQKAWLARAKKLRDKKHKKS